MLFSYHLLYFCTALSLIIMLSSHYHHHKSKTFSQLTQCPFTGTLLLLFFAKHKNAYILKTVLDRADCADFGCHNSIRLETKHFLNTLALTFISFSGRYAKTSFFFASDPLVYNWSYRFGMVNHRKSWAGNVFVWLDLTLDPFFKVERGYCICSISLNMF